MLLFAEYLHRQALYSKLTISNILMILFQVIIQSCIHYAGASTSAAAGFFVVVSSQSGSLRSQGRPGTHTVESLFVRVSAGGMGMWWVICGCVCPCAPDGVPAAVSSSSASSSGHREQASERCSGDARAGECRAASLQCYSDGGYDARSSRSSWPRMRRCGRVNADGGS
jgi:hypothetical protein